VHASDVQPLTIGEVAKAAQIGVETVRFYEREGLIAEPPRRRSGYRQYPPDTIRRLRFIRGAKELGFTLREIKELLDLRVDPAKSCADVRALAKLKIADIDTKMADLARIQAALEKLARACRGEGPTSECPILDALDDQEDGNGNR
jgi:MerR family transcriptional regulator, copper efflux regulator